MALTWASDFAPVVYEFFKTGVDMVPSLIPTLYNVQGSMDAKEYRKGVGGTSTVVWDEYNLTGQTGHADIDPGYATTFEHSNYTARFSVKRNDINDRGGISVVQTGLQEMGISAAQKRETDAASTFVNAFDSDFTGADGVSLCNASHPQGPNDTGTTYSNTGTAAFNYTNVKAARQAMRNFVDQQGNPLFRNATLGLVPIELNDEVLEITTLQGKPGTANNDANAIVGFEFRQWDYLTDANDWWLLDPIWMRQHLQWFDRAPLTMMIVDETTTDVTYEFHMRYSYGWTDPRFVYGNEVT
jgi:hypothetical protein